MSNYIAQSFIEIIKLVIDKLFKTKTGIIITLCGILILVTIGIFQCCQQNVKKRITTMEYFLKNNEFLCAIEYFDKTKIPVICKVIRQLSSTKNAVSELEKGKEYFENKEYYEASKSFESALQYLDKDDDKYFYVTCWKQRAEFENKIKPKYDEIKRDTVCKYCGLRYVYKEGKGFGFIDKFGNEINKEWYYKVWPFENCIALVHSHGKYAYIDTLADYKIDYFSHFIGLNNRPIFPIRDNYVESNIFNKYHFALIERDKKIGVINIYGDVIAECIYVGGEHNNIDNYISLRKQKENGTYVYQHVYNTGLSEEGN